MKKYTSFLWEKVSFISRSEVKEWVICDVYSFDENAEKDLWIIHIKKWYSTPKQKVLKWDKTIEGLLSGTATFTLNGIITHCSNKEKLEINRWDIMQWTAMEDTVFYEVCYLPYEDGRFENI